MKTFQLSVSGRFPFLTSVPVYLYSYFKQDGYRVYQSLESLLSKACKHTSDLDVVCDFYGNDFNKDLLTSQLQILLSGGDG